MQLPESSSLEQSLSGPQAARALGVTVADKEKTKEMKEREKVEKRLTEVCVLIYLHTICSNVYRELGVGFVCQVTSTCTKNLACKAFKHSSQSCTCSIHIDA